MIFLILFLALGLRLINLNQSLWLDEAVQAVVAKNSLAFAFEELKGDFHPPLFHLLMHFWVRIFGASEISLRMPSVLFGVGTVFIIWKISKLSHLGHLRDLAAIFLATAPFHIYYSQEARMYSMVTFFSSLSMYFFIKSIKVINIINYIFFTSLALYSDYYAGLVFLSQIIVVLVFFRKKFIKLLPSFLFVILLFLPGVPLLKSQIKTGVLATRNLPGWGKLVNVSFLKALPVTFIKFSLGRITIFDKKIYALVTGVVLGVFGAIGSWGLFKSYNHYNRYNQHKIFLSWLLVPLVISWLVSLWIPNYQPFRLLLVLPAFYLLLAGGISSIRSKKLKIAASVFIFTVSVASLLVYYQHPFFWREDWRGVANFAKKENTPIIISAQAFNWPLVYYQAEEKIINVASGAQVVQISDIPPFLEKVSHQKQLFYTPYLADLYDPQKLVPKWLEKDGFVKIKEISFNQIPLWVYKK